MAFTRAARPASVALPAPPLRYDRENEAQTRAAVEQALLKTAPAADGVSQFGGRLMVGMGAPDNAMGRDNDVYLRADGAVGTNTFLYHKESGVWVAAVTS